jgi:hypothetical protein
MSVVQLPAIRLQVMAQVNDRSNTRQMAEAGYIDVVGGGEKSTLLDISAVSIHATMCPENIEQDQLVLSHDGVVMFEFPARSYPVHDKEHLGMAITLYINKGGKDSIQHSVASTTYVNFDQIMSGQLKQLGCTLNDVNKTPATILFQGLMTVQQNAWNHQNAALLQNLSSKFNSINRIQERLTHFAQERIHGIKNFLDPNNKNNVHTALSMPSNLVKHVMNIDIVDNAQSEFFKQVCTEESPQFLLKYAPLASAMLLTTAVKFLSKDDSAPLTYKCITDKLANIKWTHADAELWTQIFCNCLTSIVPACNTYTSDASWLVNADGVRVIPNLVGEEQLLLGSPVVQAVQDIQSCQHLSGLCQEMFSSGDLQKSELAFRAAHEARLKTVELCKSQDCEDFAADMRNYFGASTHVHVMTTTANQMIGTPLLCSDARLNLPRNTLQDARQALLACCAVQRHIRDLIQYKCQDCVCIATAANLTSKYCPSLDEKPTQIFERSMFENRDMFLMTSTPGAAGHCCRIRTNSTMMHTQQLENGVNVHFHALDVLCMQESTSSTIFRELNEPADVFDVKIQVGFGNTKIMNGMTRSLVRNVTGSIYGDMLTNSGLSASHAADRMGTKDFYKVLCAVGGKSILAAEKTALNTTLTPTEMLDSMLRGCKDTQYYFGAQNVQGVPIMALEFELKPEEQHILRMLARAQAPLYSKGMPLILASGTLGSCFFPRIDSICSHIPGSSQNNNINKQLFVVPQKTPLLGMTDVLKSKSVESLLDVQKAHVSNVLRETCKTQFDFFSDHISTDIMLLHTHIAM